MTKTNADMKAMESGVRKQLTGRYIKEENTLGWFQFFILLFSLGLIGAGGIVGSWTSIVAGTIILIFIGWSVKN